MGADLFLHVVIGVQLGREQLGRNDLVPGCGHQTDIGDRFCRKCGREIRLVKSWLLHDYVDHDDEGYNISGMRLFSDQYDYLTNSVAGYEVEITDEYGDMGGIIQIPMLALLEIDDIRTKVKEVLQPLQLWDEDKFGIHVVAGISY